MVSLQLFLSKSIQIEPCKPTSALDFCSAMEFQMSTKVKTIFLAILHDKLNAREVLRRRNMELESNTCENYMLQKTETCLTCS